LFEIMAVEIELFSLQHRPQGRIGVATGPGSRSFAARFAKFTARRPVVVGGDEFYRAQGQALALLQF
jgi:hypothetical protein